MTFEEKIIKNSSIRQSKLMRPAKIALEKPDTGVTINKKGAYYLIKDSADITVQYLVHLCYGSYNDPINDLKGKFTQSEIIDFVGRSKEEKNTNQLLSIILADLGYVNQSFEVDEVVEEEELDLTIGEDEDDVYGDYETETVSTTTQSASTSNSEPLDINDVSGVIQKLIEVFEAK